jgi:hypothetical protein
MEIFLGLVAFFNNNVSSFFFLHNSTEKREKFKDYRKAEFVFKKSKKKII